METIPPQLELVERLSVVLRLLRDAGAEDVAARLSVEAGEAIYHGLVHSVRNAAARWRVSQDAPPEDVPPPDSPLHTGSP